MVSIFTFDHNDTTYTLTNMTGKSICVRILNISISALTSSGTILILPFLTYTNNFILIWHKSTGCNCILVTSIGQHSHMVVAHVGISASTLIEIEKINVNFKCKL